MTRMTNNLRDAIVSAALDKCGYTAARVAYYKRKEEWSERVRLDSLGMPEAELLKIEQRAKKEMAKAPEAVVNREGSLRRRSNLILNVAGQRDTVRFSGDEEKVSNFKHDMAFDHPLAVEREALINEDSRLSKWYSDVEAHVRAAVNAVNTVAQLLKAWPESKELIPAHVPEAKSQLPAVQVADLNALIGLPSE